MPTTTLSSREKDVVQQMAQGKTYKEAAEALGLKFETVKTYLARIRKKLGVTSKVKIALWAIENGMVYDGGNDAAA